MTTPQEIEAAETFLARKLREAVAQSNVPALAAVLVRDAGDTVVSGAQGIRKVGASGAANQIKPWDKFNLGSVSKVYTAHLIGAMIEAKTSGLWWTTTLAGAKITLPSGAQQVYANVAIDLYTVHASGMPYTPAGDNIDDWLGFTTTDATPAKRRARRLAYLNAAVKDPLVCRCNEPGKGDCKDDGIDEKCKEGQTVCQPGDCVHYGGGPVLNACILEKLDGGVFEDLMQKYVYAPLGMTHSGFGRLSGTTLDGPWQHTWDPATRVVAPDADFMKIGIDIHPRNPVGGACSSAADMGKFLAEQLRPAPKVFKTQRFGMQTLQPSTASNFVRGGWASSLPGSAMARIGHNGDNGRSYADTSVNLAKKVAVAAMSNINSKLSAAPVSDMLDLARAMDANWTALFSGSALPSFELAHPMPAITCTIIKHPKPQPPTQVLNVFARRHDGAVHVRHSDDGGATWGAVIALGGWIMSSGIAAAASPNGHVYMFGRGTDNRIWFGKSGDGGKSWSGSWPVPMGTFQTGPGVAVDAAGTHLAVVAIGMDRKMYIARSADGGAHWGSATAIGQGTFTSAPAIACSSDGHLVHVFGRGDDYRIWRNLSTDGGKTFRAHWVPTGTESFTSSPAAASNAAGTLVHVVARGSKRDVWRARINADSAVTSSWSAVGGTLVSAPAIATSGADSHLHLYGLGTGFTLRGTQSPDAGSTWSTWKKVANDVYI